MFPAPIPIVPFKDSSLYLTVWSFDIEGFAATSVPVIAPGGTDYFTATGFGFDNHEQDDPDADEMLLGLLFADKNRRPKWAFEFECMMASAPVLAPDGIIYFTTGLFDDFGDMGPGRNGPMGGEFFALRDAQTEALVGWKSELDGPMISQPVIYRG